MIAPVYAKLLQRAAELLGGREELRRQLRVSMRELDAWMSGAEKPPTAVFLQAVDVVSGAPAPASLLHAPAAVQRSRQLRQELRASRVALARTLARARRIQAVILAGPERAPPPKPVTALSFLETKFEPAQGREMVEAALDAALAATGAYRGNVQLLHRDALRIVAQRRFEEPFLRFFAHVDDARSACGAALGAAARIVVSEVAGHAVFAGPSGAVMLEAGCRAVQSTPLVASSGMVLGMLSTHFERPHAPSERELDVIDHIARRTAFWLEGGAI